MVVQAITAHFLTREGSVATVGALFGLKPIIDGINIVFDIPPPPGALSSLVAFGYTRGYRGFNRRHPVCRLAVIQSLALMVDGTTLDDPVGFVWHNARKHFSLGGLC